MKKQIKVGFEQSLNYLIEEIEDKTISNRLSQILYIICDSKPNSNYNKKYALSYWQYVLDFLCYAYYVQADSIVSDYIFDQLERQFCSKFPWYETAPMRGMEGRLDYTSGVKFVYDFYKKMEKTNERNTNYQKT